MGGLPLVEPEVREDRHQSRPQRRLATFLSAVANQTSERRAGLPHIEQAPTTVLVRSGDTTWNFTPTEWAAFTAGIAIGEFASA